ncbi:MAG: sulfatase [Bacteroidales bacterium]|jgi:arylsulfatase
MKYLPQSLTGLFSLGLLAGCAQKQDPATPNVVLIFMDDMGYGDLTCYGAPSGYRTPNIDRLAASGLRFTQFYSAQAVSTASRAGLMTGCYPNRIGLTGAINHNARHGINENEMTMAELLKQKGYATGMVGKWHLGHLKPFLPLQNGFDEFLGLPYSNDMWPVGYQGYAYVDSLANKDKPVPYPPLPLIAGNDTIQYMKSLADQDDLTTRYTERAVTFIKKNKKDPFFLYFAHSMVHTPLAVSKKFQGKSKQGRFGDVMMEVDWSVGEIMKTLDDLGLTDNTLVIFTSDNGPWLNFGAHAGNTAGLREGKGVSFEGGQRVPCIMRWPDVIPAGTVTGQLASTIDLFPTFASITGTSMPIHMIDGVDISPILRGDFECEPRQDFYYYYNRNSLEAVRSGNWKLVMPHPYRSYIGVMPRDDGKPGPYASGISDTCLYDLRRDPGERYDVKAIYPEIVKTLQLIVDKARLDLGDDLTGAMGTNRRQPGKIR